MDGTVSVEGGMGGHGVSSCTPKLEKKSWNAAEEFRDLG